MTTKLKAAKTIMLLAAVYNIFWGIVISAYPQIILFGNPPTDFLLIILRCVGMLAEVELASLFILYRYKLPQL